MRAYSLVGVDGNAYAIIGYTAKAMRRAGLNEEIKQMQDEATSGDYTNLLCVCDSWIDKANKKLGLEEGLEEGFEDDEF